MKIDDDKNFKVEKLNENEMIITIRGKSNKETLLHCTNNNGEKKVIIISLKNGISSIKEKNNY